MSAGSEFESWTFIIISSQNELQLDVNTQDSPRAGQVVYRNK